MPHSKPKRPEAPAEKPAFHASYELTSLMTQEATSLLVPGGATNPAYIACAVCLVALVAFCFLVPNANPAIAVAGAAACAALLVVAGRWGDAVARRVAAQGWNAVALPEDARRVTVDVWPDRIEVVRADRDAQVTPLAEVKDVKHSDSMIVVRFRDGSLALIPRRALSLQRFRACLDLVESRGASEGR